MSHAYRIMPIGSDYIISGINALQFAVIKINSSGGVLWYKTFGGINQDHCFGMDVATDGPIFLTGHTISETVAPDETVDSTPWETFTMKLDSSGNHYGRKNVVILADLMLVTFMTKHGASKQPVMAGALSRQGRDEYPYSAQVGGVYSDQWEAYIVKYDASGNLEWEETFRSEDFV